MEGATITVSGVQFYSLEPEEAKLLDYYRMLYSIDGGYVHVELAGGNAKFVFQSNLSSDFNRLVQQRKAKKLRD